MFAWLGPAGQIGRTVYAFAIMRDVEVGNHETASLNLLKIALLLYIRARLSAPPLPTVIIRNQAQCGDLVFVTWKIFLGFSGRHIPQFGSSVLAGTRQQAAVSKE